MGKNRPIEITDIIDRETYARRRKQLRAEMVALKRNRRVAIGPNATAHFENFATMLYQVHEMLHAERGGETQLADELAAYNPLIPRGSELVCTLMLEMEDPARRSVFLSGLGGIERTTRLEIGGEIIPAEWEQDVERTSDSGKASAVHFLRFALSREQAAKMKMKDARVIVSIEHPNYGHATVLPELVRAELAADLSDPT